MRTILKICVVNRKYLYEITWKVYYFHYRHLGKYEFWESINQRVSLVQTFNANQTSIIVTMKKLREIFGKN